MSLTLDIVSVGRFLWFIEILCIAQPEAAPAARNRRTGWVGGHFGGLQEVKRGVAAMS